MRSEVSNFIKKKTTKMKKYKINRRTASIFKKFNYENNRLDEFK